MRCRCSCPNEKSRDSPCLSRLKEAIAYALSFPCETLPPRPSPTEDVLVMEDHARLFLSCCVLSHPWPGVCLSWPPSCANHEPHRPPGAALCHEADVHSRGGDPIMQAWAGRGCLRRWNSPRRCPFPCCQMAKGGSRVDLPGGETYTVRIEEGKPGRYTHWVIVDRLPIR